MKLNPWLAEKLRGVDPKNFRLIVEVDPKYFSEAKIVLRRMGLSIISTSFNKFITVKVPDVATIEAIERLPFVIEVHYDMPRYIAPFPLGLKIKDPLLGEIRVSEVEIPGFPTIMAPVPLPGVKRPGIEIIPTSVSKKWVVDIETTLSGRGVKVAVIDTGLTPTHPQVFPSLVELHSTVPEPPFDFMGHGQWCSLTVYGRAFPTRFGRVEGIASDAKKMHIKALTTPGFGSDTSVLKAMEIAWRRGARVVSMSLGGEQQGPVGHDPECKAARILARSGAIVVVAAGNSGPDKWTIGSPGACPDVLTVGSISIMDEGEVVWFSSRGPQGKWYRDHRSDYEEDLAKYGDDLIKPDVVAPGGGRKHESDSPDEVLYQGTTGWFDGFYDLVPDGYEGMHGTSQATPHVAGLMALLKEAVPNLTVAEVKAVLRAQGEKSVERGWGLARLSLFVGP